MGGGGRKTAATRLTAPTQDNTFPPEVPQRVLEVLQKELSALCR